MPEEPEEDELTAVSLTSPGHGVAETQDYDDSRIASTPSIPRPTPMNNDEASPATNAEDDAYDNIVNLSLLRHFKEGPGQWLVILLLCSGADTD